MTDKEILSKVVDKAIANGWTTEYLEMKVQILKSELLDLKIPSLSMYLRGILLSYSFAEAFWGKETINTASAIDPDYDSQYHIAWQYHLQQMVLYENPLEYLKQFIKEEEK